MSSQQNIILPKVFLSPFVLSTIMLDNSNCSGDQEGFLLGKTYKSTRYEINDESTCNTEEDYRISVYSAYPCGNFLSFYNCKGEIDIDFIYNFLGDRIKCLIGWYRFRRNVPSYPSAREAIVHRNLMNIFSENLVIGGNYFAYGCFGSSISESCATYTYDYAFYIEQPEEQQSQCQMTPYSYVRFISLGMSILNLIDTKTKYRSGSLASSFVNSQTFDSVLNISWSFESCWQTEDGIQEVHKVLRDKCSNLAEELTASECINASIEEDIKRLENELKSLDMSEKQPSPCMEETEEETNVDQENVENVAPKEESSNTRRSKKRYWHELVYFENGKQHPVYGRYFKHNRAVEQESISQASSEASDSGYYVHPPQKKLKVLEEHKRVIDHDYSSASDEDSHKYAQEVDDDQADELDGVSLPSETEDYASTDDSKSIHDVEIEVPAAAVEDTETDFLDNQTDMTNSQRIISSETSSDNKISIMRSTAPVEYNQESVATNILCSPENAVFKYITAVSEEVVVTSQDLPDEKNYDLQTFETSVQERSFAEGCEYLPISSDEQEEENDESNDNQTVEEDFSLTLCQDGKDESKKGTGSPLKSYSSGRPIIIYCKPANKDEDSTISHK